MEKLITAPSVKFSAAFITGILIGTEFYFNPLIVTSIILTNLIVILILVIADKSRVLCLLFLLVLIVLTGIYKSNIDNFFTAENSVSIVPDTKRDLSIILTGVIGELPEIDSNRTKLLLESRSVISGKDTFIVSGNVLAVIRKNIFSSTEHEVPELNAGDLISLKGKLSAPSGRRNPGEFDYKKYLEIHNVSRIFYVNGYNNSEVITDNSLNPFYGYLLFPAKEFVIKTIDRNYSGDEAGYLKGLVTGERGDISDEMKESFINAGVMHLIAVSGLNVAYVILTVSLILAILRVPLLPRVLITICFLIFYCMFTGSTASIVRASIMGILVLIALLIERRINFYNIAGVAAMCILVYDTKQLFDPGFILSFSATLSMVVFFKKFESTILCRLRDWNVSGKKVTLVIVVLFLTSLSAQIGTIPITASYFGKISVVSLIANVIAVPLANLSLAMGFLQIIAAAFSDYLSSVIAETINLLLYLQLQFIKWCASLDFAFIELEEFNYADIICYYLLIFVLLSIRNSKQLAFRIVLCALIVCGLYVHKYDFSQKMTVTFLDIGQGDCALIQTPDKTNILVDCGGVSLNSNSGERTILPYLKRKGIRRIDLMIITHLHLDHIGGINHLINNIEIGKIVESGQDHKSSFIDTMDSLILVKNIPREIIRKGDCISDLKDIRIYFVFPDQRFVNSEGKTIGNNLNNGSVAFILKYKNTDFFYTGDIEKESELFLCSTYSEFLETDVLKVAHHGSNTSSTQEFIDNNKPDYAVISCGLYNKFNHPSEVTLSVLDNAGAVISRTDLEGAVIFESDGDRVEKIEWR